MPLAVTTTVEPATQRSSDYAYGIRHDGVHWSGSFNVLLSAFLNDLVQEAPTGLTFDVYLDPHAETLTRVAGEVVATTNEEISFADGYTLSRTASDIIAAWVTTG